MADTDSIKETKDFCLDVPFRQEPFFVKGSVSLDWGMQNRLARIFNPKSGHTLMLAIDHGYFQGPTSGLERVDVNIVPLAPYADALMLTRGILRTSIPSSYGKGVVLRASGGPSVLRELSNEQLAMDIEDALRLNAAAMAVQVFIGGEFETQSIYNLTRLVDAGNRYGMPILGVTAVGKNMTRDARYFRLATRMAAELGAEVFVLDAGWFNRQDWSRELGDWQADPAAFPHGLGELAQQVHQPGQMLRQDAPVEAGLLLAGEGVAHAP